MCAPKLYICITCRQWEGDKVRDAEAGQKLHKAIQNSENTLKDVFEIIPTECLSLCKKACAVAFASEGKYSYLLSNLNELSIDDIWAFAKIYQEKEGGIVRKVDRPEGLRDKIQGRLPPLIKKPCT